MLGYTIGHLVIQRPSHVIIENQNSPFVCNVFREGFFHANYSNLIEFLDTLDKFFEMDGYDWCASPISRENPKQRSFQIWLKRGLVNVYRLQASPFR